MSRLLISFSGGETSAYMTKVLLESNSSKYDEKVVVFANTGQEHPETLAFVDYVDSEYGFNIVWVEAVVDPRKQKGTRHRVVNYETACRDESLFEDMVRKYGMSNQAYPHCTRELKLAPIQSYAKSIGWNTYDTAIGIRKDEVDRMSDNAERDGLIYPLVSRYPMNKADINTFWREQTRRLNITGYEGNCVWCWKKSYRKHFTIIQDDASWYDVPKYLEDTYPTAGNNIDGTPRVFFRKNTSTVDLLEMAKQPFTRADDENQRYESQLDLDWGCSDSCEVY